MIRRGGGKFAVSLRQQLKTAAQVEQFCEELAALLEAEVRAGRTPAFDDFDVSQSSIHSEGFEEIFLHLLISEAHVERFKAFGCAAFNDAVASSMADWLSRASGEAMPAELHLSDCAITAKGFESLASALEGNEDVPVQDQRDPARTIPVYVRLEHNYIDDETLRARQEAGAMAMWRKTDPIPQDPGVKWRLVVWDLEQFGQRRGSPPAFRPPPDASVGRGVVIAPKGRTPSQPSTPTPSSAPALVVPGTRQPTVMTPAPTQAKPALAKRVLAPKAVGRQPQPQTVLPPQRAATRETSKAIGPPQPLVVPPRTAAPKTAAAPAAAGPQPPAGPPPAAAKAAAAAAWAAAGEALRQSTPAVRPPGPRKVAPLLTSTAKAPPQAPPVVMELDDEPEEVEEEEEDAKPRPPRFPPPTSVIGKISQREKMVAAPKCKVRAKPY